MEASMKKCIMLSLALVVLVSPATVFSQSTAATESTGTQQNPSANCSNATEAPGEPCPQNGTPTPPSAADMDPGRSTERTNSLGPDDILPERNERVTGKERESKPDLPTEFQKFVAATTGQLLPMFGASLFRNIPSTFSPSDIAPASPKYVIGPDDEMRVRIWGPVSYNGNLRVDRSGDIFIPQVGSVHVAGLPFSEVDQHLRQAVARLYRNFDLSVDLGHLRSIQIYVTGRARRPGVYTVSSLSSLVDALFASGGPSPQGSLRHILLKRDGAMVADFDLYALLNQGDKSKDVRLLPEDVLFIPAAGPEVAIQGSIAEPAIYELRAHETVGDLIEEAGKTTGLSSTERISIERTGEDQHRHAMEVRFDESGRGVQLTDGDILRIYPILPTYEKTVVLRGNVANAGRFSWHEGMRLSDLIPDQDSLVSRDYWWKRSHLGLPVPEFEPMINSLGQEQKTTTDPTSKSSTPPPLTPESLTSAATVNDPQDSNDAADQMQHAASTGSIAAGIKRGSSTTVQGKPQVNTVRLLAPEIDWDYAVIERLDPKTLRTTLIPFGLGKMVLDHDPSQDLALQPGDSVTVFSQGDIRVPLDHQTTYITLEGEFVRSGIYSVEPGETLRDVVGRAGGLTKKAYLYGAEFTRESARLLQQQRIDEYARAISTDSQRGTQALAMAGTGSGNNASDVAASRVAAQELSTRLSLIKATGRVVLEFAPDSSDVDSVPAINIENGDRFVVPYQPATVNVVGAVYDQNSFLFHERRTVSQYLKLAGGSNRDADAHHSFVIRADGSVVGRSSVKGFGGWSKTFEALNLNPGDTLVVPEKTLRPTALRGLMDWTQIFSQLALGAAAINII
jgi:protein involved in polysaccharide export with SLBB domain